MDLKLGKRAKYLIQAAFFALFLFIYSKGYLGSNYLFLAPLIVFFVSLGSIFTHYPNINIRNFFYSILMPLSIVFGSLLVMIYFPNLGDLFKILLIINFAFIYYIISLVDNIFLVIHDRDSIIPLYRAALTWSQILQVTIAIPLFAGLYKLDIISVYQVLIMAIIAFFFAQYQLWIHRFDSDAKKTGVGESIFLSFLVFFIVLGLGIATSFVPAEAFLRALFVSVGLLFGLTYLSSHLKNEINKKMMFRFGFLGLIFVLLMLLFNP